MAFGMKTLATALCVPLVALCAVSTDGASVTTRQSTTASQWMTSSQQTLYGNRNIGFANGGSGNIGAFNGLGNTGANNGNYNTGAYVWVRACALRMRR